MCIQDLHLVALENLCDCGLFVTFGDCHHLDGLEVVDSVEAYKEDVWCSEEVIVRGIMLTSREPRRATLVERDAKGDKWSGWVEC